MAILTADEILKCTDLPRELVQVPEWKGEVYVRQVESTEKDALEERWMATSPKARQKITGYRADLASLTICDADGQRLFTSAQAAALGKLSCVAMDRVIEVAGRLNKITQKDVDELLGNSDAGRNGDSVSALPLRSA